MADYCVWLKWRRLIGLPPHQGREIVVAKRSREPDGDGFNVLRPPAAQGRTFVAGRRETAWMARVAAILFFLAIVPAWTRTPLVSNAWGQAIPVGPEFQVNTYTYAAQEQAAVAADPAGNFVVVWLGDAYGGHDGIFGQRYSSSATREGPEFPIKTEQFGDPPNQFPAVAADSAGNFVVVWRQRRTVNEEFVEYGVGQRFERTGMPRGGEFQVNSSPFRGSGSIPDLASDDAGDFVVVWQGVDQGGSEYSFGIVGQRFDSTGARQGDEIQVNTYTTGDQRFPKVASDAGGNFVVVWISSVYGEGLLGIFGQRFDSTGAREGGEFQVNTYTTGNFEPAVASDAGGNFVVVWSGVGDGDADGIFGQLFDRTGARRGREFLVNTYTTGNQQGPVVASDAGGNFVVLWSPSSFQTDGILGQLFDSAGVRRGSEFQVNTYTTLRQFDPAVSWDSAGDFVVTWASEAQDGDATGVFAQRYNTCLGSRVSIDCTSSGQLCNPPLSTSVSVASSSELTVSYQVGARHCSPVRLHVYLDDNLVRTTDLLGWRGATGEHASRPLGTGPLSLGLVEPGVHEVRLEAEGEVGGCNAGQLGTWGGCLSVGLVPSCPNIAIDCESPGQVCEPPFSTSVSLASPAQLITSYQVGGRHCSPTRLRVYLDDNLVRTTDLLGWPGATGEHASLPLGTGPLNLGLVGPGDHEIRLQAEGEVGGCNEGRLGTWGGCLTILPSCPNVGIDCESIGQLCDPPFSTSVPIASRSRLGISYSVGERHCSAVRLHVYLDGSLVRSTQPLGWPGATGADASLPLSTGPLDLGIVEPGDHEIRLQAEGEVGGCDDGRLGSWGGCLNITQMTEGPTVTTTTQPTTSTTTAPTTTSTSTTSITSTTTQTSTSTSTTTTGATSTTTTSTTAATTSTTTTTLPCTSARCTLDAALATSACAGQTIPPSVLNRLNRALDLIDQAGAAIGKRAVHLLGKAKAILKKAARAAGKAAKGKQPKLPAACATAIQQAADAVHGGLGG